MAVRKNVEDLAHEFPTAAKVVQDSFYVDDGLTGSDTVDKAIILRKYLQELFARGRFLLRKWNSNSQGGECSSSAEGYSKTLGLEWNSHLDSFQLTISDLPDLGCSPNGNSSQM